MKKINKLALILIPIGVAINFVCNLVFGNLTGHMVIGDSIGTVLVAVTCGIVPGMLTGLLSNLVSVAAMPVMIFYAPINMLYGLIAGLLARKLIFKSFGKTLATAPVYALAGGTIGTCITYAMMQGEFSGSMANVLIAMPLYAMGIPKLMSMIAGAVVFDIVDKICVMVIVLLVIKALPDRFLIKLPGAKYVVKKAQTTKSDLDDE